MAMRFFTYKRARNAAVSCYSIAVALYAGGYFAFGLKTKGLASCFALSLPLFITGVLITLLFCRCPHCGGQIYKQVLLVKKCPYCEGELLGKAGKTKTTR